jgi:hypothetical protein
MESIRGTLLLGSDRHEGGFTRTASEETIVQPSATAATTTVIHKMSTSTYTNLGLCNKNYQMHIIEVASRDP